MLEDLELNEPRLDGDRPQTENDSTTSTRRFEVLPPRVLEGVTGRSSLSSRSNRDRGSGGLSEPNWTRIGDQRGSSHEGCRMVRSRAHVRSRACRAVRRRARPSSLAGAVFDDVGRPERLEIELELAVDFSSLARSWRSCSIRMLWWSVSKCCQAEKSNRPTVSEASRQCAGTHACSRLLFAKDRIVPDVLLDCVLEIEAHATLSNPRRRALRARGFRSHSTSLATSGRLVSNRAVVPSSARRRNVCFTTRSSSE